MEEAPIRALLVEDDADEVMLLTDAIRDAGAKDISIVHSESRAGALQILSSRPIDAVLLDLSLPDSSGIEGVSAVLEAAGEAPVIVFTGLNDQTIAQEAIRTGAQDYLVKNPKLYAAVPRILRHTVERCRIIAASNKKILQARQYTELLLTKVISVADSGLGITDERGAFHVVNPALAELRGCTISDLVGRPWTDILPAKRRKAELQAYLKSLESEADYGHERLVIERKDGSKTEVSVHSVRVCLGENRPCRVLSFGTPNRTVQPVEHDSNEAHFTETVKQRIGDRPAEFSAGRVMVVGLQKLKDELGGRWDRVADRVREIAEKSIAARLSVEDSFTATPTYDYLVCFGKANQVQASATIAEIVKDVRKRIVAVDGSADPGVGDLKPEIRARLADVESMTQRIRVKPTEIAESGAITGVITEKINQSVERARAATHTMLIELNGQSRARVRDVHTRDRGAASLAMHDLDPDSRVLRDRVINLANSAPDVLAEVDIILLGNAAQKIYDFGTVKAPLLAVEIHLSTLLDPVLCEKYTSLCQSLGGIATRSIVFNVLGISTSSDSEEIRSVLSPLEPYSRFRMMELKKPGLGNLNLKIANIALLSIAYGDIMNLFYRDPARSKRFVKQVHSQGARIVIDRVTAVDGAHLFKDFNVDFVSYEPSTARVA